MRVLGAVSLHLALQGRGHESDVRIPDVSISRYHATIRFVEGHFQLEDHNSKFGTLVSLRKAFPIGDTGTYRKGTRRRRRGRTKGEEEEERRLRGVRGRCCFPMPSW